MIRRIAPVILTLGFTLPAQAQEAQGALQQARSLAQQARAAYPRNAWNVDKPLWRQAALAADLAVQQAPRDLAALQTRAQIYTDVGFWARAEEAWNAYFQAGGQDPEAARGAAETQYNLGFAAYRREQLDAARTAFNKCLQFARDARCASWGGRVELESGRPARAAEYYAQAVQLAPNDKTNQYFLDLSRRAAQYGPEAVSAFSRAYRAFDAGNKPVALEGFVQASQLAPQFTEAHRQVGRLAMELGRPQLAREAWEAVVLQGDATDGDRFNLNLAREVERYGQEAVQTFRNAYTRYTLGDRSGAEQGFMQATTLSPEYQKAWAWLGRTRYEQENYAGAADAYAVAARLDPADKSSAYFLEQAQKRR